MSKVVSEQELAEIEAFAQLINHITGNGLDEAKIAELADDIGVSRPTVKRWATRQTAPHPITIKAATRYIKKKYSL